MKKTDLISQFQKQSNLSYQQAQTIIHITFESMINALYADDRIEIRGFCTFENRNYKAYAGRNPKTGKLVTVPPKKVPFCKIGKELKKIVGESKDKYVIREG